MDVKPLYTNISNSEGIAATKRALDKRTNKTLTTKVNTTYFTLIFNCKQLYFKL